MPLLNRKDERDEPPTLELQLEKSELIPIVPSAANKLVTAGKTPPGCRGRLVYREEPITTRNPLAGAGTKVEQQKPSYSH
jgi:hypothetical protein